MKGHLNDSALKVLQARYLRRDPENGQIVETPEDLFQRVANSIAQAEAPFGNASADWEVRYLEVMTNLDFLPNSPCLMNAGTPLACSPSE